MVVTYASDRISYDLGLRGLSLSRLEGILGVGSSNHSCLHFRATDGAMGDINEKAYQVAKLRIHKHFNKISLEEYRQAARRLEDEEDERNLRMDTNFSVVCMGLMLFGGWLLVFSSELSSLGYYFICASIVFGLFARTEYKAQLVKLITKRLVR